MRESARRLRERGRSIAEITEALQAKKSTVSYWCRDIRLSAEHLKRLTAKKAAGGRLGILRAAELKRTERLAAVQKETLRGARDVGRLTRRDIFIVGIALYWGEGYKRGNEECGFTNSDPGIVKSFIRWMMDVYDIKREDFILRVSINATYKGREKEIKSYWSSVTGIPLSQFTRSSFIFAAQKKTTRDPATYFGTLRLKVRRATALRRRILGSIAEIERQITR